MRRGVLRAATSVAISTADFKAMLVPPAGVSGGRRRRAPSIVHHLAELVERGVEVRLLHSGVPSRAAMEELNKLRKDRPHLTRGFVIRRCPRLHTKLVIVDAAAAYLGSANLTGAGLGAKGATRRNFELGVWTRAPALVDAAMERFNDLWEGCHCDGCGRRDVCPEPLEEPW